MKIHWAVHLWLVQFSVICYFRWKILNDEKIYPESNYSSPSTATTSMSPQTITVTSPLVSAPTLASPLPSTTPHIQGPSSVRNVLWLPPHPVKPKSSMWPRSPVPLHWPPFCSAAFPTQALPLAGPCQNYPPNLSKAWPLQISCPDSI